MDWAREYIKNEKVPINKLERINHMRIFKKMYLPCELVGFKGQNVTKEMREWNESRAIRWKVMFKEVIKSPKILVEVWKEFVDWLKNQKVDTIIDFDDKITTKYEISFYRRVVKVNNRNTKYYKACESRYGQTIYERVDNVENTDLRKSITEIK